LSRRALALFAACAALSACAGSERVTRVAGGFREEGRYIDTQSYSAFMGGVIAEASGRYADARLFYQQALDDDADSPEIQARIGAVSCKLAVRGARAELRAAERAFDEALELDSSFAPAYYERAVCARARGRREQALRDAKRAVKYDSTPVAYTRLVSELLFESGRASEAWAWLDALVVRTPDWAEAWSAYRSAAERTSDAVRLRRALANQIRLGAPEPRPEASDTEAIDALLLLGDLPAARIAAKARHWRSSELALRSVEIGALEVGYEQAMLVLGADPGDADAWIAALAAAEDQRLPERFEAALVALDPRPLPPSARAVTLLESLLARRVGADAARALRQAWEAGPAPRPDTD
jgi:tetratricopeptide (TPR) repeat protein